MLHQPNGADFGVGLRDVTVRFGRVLALDKVSGEFPHGSLTAVVGPNGAGKSTLLSAIAGTVAVTEGTIRCPASAHLAYLPQVSTLARDYPVTVGELILLGGWREFGAFRAPSAAARKRAAMAAAEAGLTHRLARRISELSVGELQRALFARLIFQQAGLILLDEPFAAVDAHTSKALLRLIKGWNEEGRTVIVVLHDLELVRTQFPATLVLAGCCVAWGKTADALSALV